MLTLPALLLPRASLLPSTETYFVHLYGTKIADDTTFTLTFRGRTTAPIVWGPSSTTLPNRRTNIENALEAVAMEIGSVTLTGCYAGFDPSVAGKGLTTAFGVNTAYCVITVDTM